LAALRGLNHPGIVKVVEFAKPEDDPQYYVMEFVDGAKSLRNRMDDGSNPFHGDASKAIDAFIQLLEALVSCGQFNIVHRDLSPANVLVTTEGSIKLIDFGLCHVEDGTALTMSGEAVGTPHYRAPECAGYSETSPDIRSDLYSAGKILWSMITNKPAFEREQPVFNQLALPRILPSVPMSWHFHHIFEKTIRHDLVDRFDHSGDALRLARHIQRLIAEGAQPLEVLADNVLCPVCRIGSLDHENPVDRKGYDDFLARIKALSSEFQVCSYCSYVVLANRSLQRKTLLARRDLR
jgi:serine/threonine-protein kinase